MEQPEFTGWDAERYQELNDYFRLKIKILLETDPYLQDLLNQGKGLQLDQLTDRMTYEDQQRWQEFLHLDQLKFHQDLHNHLEGRGTPYNSRTGFSRSDSSDSEDRPTW
jgi:hypothetical protein